MPATLLDNFENFTVLLHKFGGANPIKFGAANPIRNNRNKKAP